MTTELDKETDVVSGLLTRQIREIGDKDPAAVARAFVLLLRSRGWRLGMDRPPPLTGTAGHASGQPKAPEVRQLLEDLKATCAADAADKFGDDPNHKVA